MNRLFTLTTILCLLFSIYNCQSEQKNITSKASHKKTADTQSPESILGLELLNKCIASHGGMENWNKFAGLSYEVESGGKTLFQLTELKDRKTYSKSEKFELGSDGKQIWVTPNADNVPGKSAAFYYNLDFYFVAIPFVLKDPGVNVTALGKASPDGEEYDLIKISYNSGVGLSAKDVYFLYLDPTSHQLKILTYTVSFFDKTNEKVNSAKRYLDYQNVQGLLMPTKMENYRWIDGKMGENSNRDRVFTNIKFHETIPDEKVFEVPKGAKVEAI